MLAGVYLLVSVLDDVGQSLQARNWPTVTGKLTSEPSSRFRLITPLDVSTGDVSVVVKVNPDQTSETVLVLFFVGIGMVVIGVVLWRRI